MTFENNDHRQAPLPLPPPYKNMYKKSGVETTSVGCTPSPQLSHGG